MPGGAPGVLTAVFLVLALSIIATALLCAGAPAQEKSWEFDRFDTDITVNPDASLTVRETQVVNFRGSFSFLNRDISTGRAYFSEGRTYGKVRIKDVRVLNLDGNPYTDWKTESLEGALRVHIEFSATDEQKGWIIEYTVTGAVIFAGDHDRLYWNAVSEERDVPVAKSTITVKLPEGTDMEAVKTGLYTDTVQPPSGWDSGRDGDALWWTARDIAPYTTVTVDVAFPKGMVSPPYQYRAWFGALTGSVSGAFFTLMLVGMILLWWKKGRDVGRPELDVVRYEPPEGLTPALVSFLVNEHHDVDDVTATIVDLAVRGRLTIVEEEGGRLLRKKKYRFRLRDGSPEGLLGYEKEVLDGLFEAGEDVGEKDLEDNFYTHLKGINRKIASEVKNRRLFNADPQKVKKKYFYLALPPLALPAIAFLFIRQWYDPGYWWLLVPGLALGGLSIGLVGRYMPSRTGEGTEAYSQAMGFKEYMRTAEKDELEHMGPETFQENLPYALVLGITDRWAQKFEDIYTTPPEWFVGAYPTFSTMYLAGSLSGLSNRMSTTLPSSPSSSSSGGGFGGGSSGGGFGGGGSSAG